MISFITLPLSSPSLSSFLYPSPLSSSLCKDINNSSGNIRKERTNSRDLEDVVREHCPVCLNVYQFSIQNSLDMIENRRIIVEWSGVEWR